MPKKLPRAKSKSMGRKQMKKTSGGITPTGSVRFIVDNTGGPSGAVKVNPSNPNTGGIWDPGN